MRTLDIIFSALEQACLAEGGDGGVLCVAPDYKAAADAFEAWLKTTGNTWWTRGSREGYDTFSKEQECIWFAASDLSDTLHASYVVKLAYGLTLY